MYTRGGTSFSHTVLRIGIFFAVGIAMAWGGCAMFRIPDEPPEPNPLQPVWSEDQLEEHLEYLNSGEAAERTTGTQGYARAAAYVAARMREYNLQPALDSGFRFVYSTPINYPLSAVLRTVSDAPPDSTLFFPGIDILPDGRSASGASTVRTMVVTDDTTGLYRAPVGSFGVLFRDGGVDANALLRWHRAGAVLAIVVEPLSPRFYGRRIPGLLVIQLAPRSLPRLLNPADAAAAYGDVIRLERQIVANVRTAYESRAGAMNIMGYVAGKHPQHGRELVLVCTDMDAVSDFAGVPTIDLEHFGIPAAALLELARNLSFVSRRWLLPERSVMFAVWSGSQLEHAGLRHFLEDPTWALGKISSVIYVGLAPTEEANVRSILAAQGISLHAIPPPADPLFVPSLVLVPDPSVRRLARAAVREEAVPAPDDDPVLPNLSVVIDSAVVQARQLADVAYGRLLVATTHPRPFFPALEDTLEVPGVVGEESP